MKKKFRKYLDIEVLPLSTHKWVVGEKIQGSKAPKKKEDISLSPEEKRKVKCNPKGVMSNQIEQDGS